MPGKFVVSLTFAKDNLDKATVAFVVANAALGSAGGVVFLTIEAAPRSGATPTACRKGLRRSRTS
jgi:hypothetical protein